jgi:hypothetical protein
MAFWSSKARLPIRACVWEEQRSAVGRRALGQRHPQLSALSSVLALRWQCLVQLERDAQKAYEDRQTKDQGG